VDPQGETLDTLGERELPPWLRPLVPAPHLFVALECDRPLAGPTRHRLDDCDEVLIGRGATRAFARDGHRLTLSLPDARMSMQHARLSRDGERWLVTDLGSRNGVHRHGTRIDRAFVDDGDVLTLGHTLLRFRAELPAHAAQPADRDGATLTPPAPGLETLLPRLENDFGVLREMLAASLPIMILGDTGTGKEVLARALHQLSGRAGELVAVNCGALPPNLVESELFGHVRGAFSGAVADRPGLVRAAHDGTLLLDEVGDLPLAAQTAFLRVLQERSVLAVGAQRPVKVDFALVSATHRPLDVLVAGGHFRADLFARLAGYRLTLPPLGERLEDLALIMRAILVAHDRADAIFTPAAGQALLAYDWPRNVRELELALLAALALAPDRCIDVAHLPAPIAAALPSPDDDHSDELLQRLTALMTEHAGNVSEVARALGKGRTQINRWLKRYGLDANRFRR
jgi:transcriptional regulator of acetoin/glycerol metabolism